MNSQQGNNFSIDDLRRRLFETIDGVRDGTVSLDKAKQVGDLAQVIVNTAKVEVDYLRANNGGESSFISSAIGTDNVPSGLPKGITGVTVHRIKA